MAETQSAPSLRELSEAATPGPWFTVDTPWGDGDWIVAFSPDPHAGQFICLFDASVVGLESYDEGHALRFDNAAFVTRLVSDYRAGRLIDPTTLTEAVAAARAEGRAAGLEEAARISETYVIAPGTESFVVNGHKLKGSYDDHEFIGLSVARKGWRGMTAAIRALIPAPPTTPGGRTDG